MHVPAEHRARIAVEREWAKKLNTAQLESLQKLADAEVFAKTKAAEAEQLAANAVELEAAAERIKAFEQGHQEQQAAARRSAQQLAAVERAAQVTRHACFESLPSEAFSRQSMINRLNPNNLQSSAVRVPILQWSLMVSTMTLSRQ